MEKLTEKINIIEFALKSVLEKSNQYGMAPWKWDEVKDKIASAFDAVKYLKANFEATCKSCGIVNGKEMGSTCECGAILEERL